MTPEEQDHNKFQMKVIGALERIEANQKQDKEHLLAVSDNFKRHVSDPDAHPQMKRTTLNLVYAALSVLALILGLRHELKGESPNEKVEIGVPDNRAEPDLH